MLKTFWHSARNPYEVVHDSLIFAPKIKKIGQKGFFEFKEKFDH